MNQTVSIHQKKPLWKPVVAVGMMLLLLWLTSINFLYSAQNNEQALIECMDASPEEETSCGIPGQPAGPDEKSPDAPISSSIIEEYIHDHAHAESSIWIDMMFQHKVHEAEKLCIVHTESFYPPPEA
mgnify:FL=1|jgi:hypothetical protein